MQVKKTLRLFITDFKYQFTGTISSISSKKNPYLRKATELAKENDIPERFVSDTKVIENFKNEKNEKGTLFEFRWTIEVESSEKEKTKIIAYIGDLPTKDKDLDMIFFFIGSDQNIYKGHLYDYEEYVNDYLIIDDTKKLKESEEMAYIESLDINWDERYLEALFKLSRDYGDMYIERKHIKTLLNSNDEVKKFILEESGESLSDTAPREILCDYIEDYVMEINPDEFY